jgi:hypothetical protein
VGAYKTSYDVKSERGKSPKINTSRSTARNEAKNKGTGWGLVDLKAVSAIQMLMLVEFATYNLQEAIGAGYVAPVDSSYSTSGSCDGVPNLTGVPAGDSGKVDVVWRGVEGFWGNVWEWVDGVNFENGNFRIQGTTRASYYDTSSGPGGITNATVSFESSGTLRCIKTHNSPSYLSNTWYFTPYTTFSDTSTTNYITDGVRSNFSGIKMVARGGSMRDGNHAGPFALELTYGVDNTSSFVGYRLLYIPSA